MARRIRQTLRTLRPFPSILPFARDPLWLDVPLFPRQELLLRLLYAPIRSRSASESLDLAQLVHTPTPTAGLYLPSDWTCDERGRISAKSPVNCLVCIMGRRSSKTTLAAIIEAYEIAQLLHGGRADLPGHTLPGQEIAFLNCATSEEQATVHYRLLLSQLRRLDLAPLEGSVDKGLSCLLPEQLRLMSLHSNARALRGRTAKVVVFDELAHFQRTAGPASDEEVWRALAPSVRTFADRGLVLVTSSPAEPDGVLWDLFSARGQVPGLLVAQFATWEFNPTISRADLEPEFIRHPAWAMSEYGAQFAQGFAQAFLPLDVVRAAVAHPPRDIAELDPQQAYALHLDAGLIHDRTVLAIGHIATVDGTRRAVVDTCRAWQGSRESPVSLTTIESTIRAIASRVRVMSITADPYESALLLERLRTQGFPAKTCAFSALAKGRMYARLEDWLRSGRLALPDDPHLIAELSAIQRLPGSTGARYHAPSHGPVTTDDYADALVGLLEALSPQLDSPPIQPVRVFPGWTF